MPILGPIPVNLVLQRFSSRRTLRIEVRSLPQTHRSLSLSRTLSIVVVRRGVVYTSIVPDCDVPWILPLESDLQVVVFCDQPQEPVDQVCALGLG